MANKQTRPETIKYLIEYFIEEKKRMAEANIRPFNLCSIGMGK